jgi:Fungalysin metallopeptidase (M36)/PA domain
MSPRTISRAARHVGAGSLLILVAGCAPGAPPPTGSTHQALKPGRTLRSHAIAAGGYATQVDQREVPTFIRAGAHVLPPAGSTPDSAALFHAGRYAGALGLRADALAAVKPVFSSDFGAEGAIVHLRQSVDGVEVYERELRVLLNADRSLVALSGSLHPSLPPSVAAFTRGPQTSLAAAIGHAAGAPFNAAALTDLHEANGDTTFYSLGGDGSGTDRALVRPVLFPEGARLRPAWSVEFYVSPASSTDARAWRYVMAADDGSVLERVSLTQFDSFNYKVWAEPGDLRPSDGPALDWTPHPTGFSDWTIPPFIPPQMVTMEGFNTRTPSKKPDPWLPVGAIDTQGNNADAYTDRAPPNGIGGGDFRAKITSTSTFDYTYDTSKEPTASKIQQQAGIVQAFYVANWLHEYWYDSGFDEKGKNAQLNNYGRGGTGNDRMQLQTQDFSGRDNSNMSTPGDGGSPQMQIYVWSGRDQKELHATPPDADFASGSAQFGPDAFTLDGILTEVDDKSFPSVTDACEPIQNDITGKIALVDRGSCTFKKKSVNVENAGGIGILIVNNVNGDAPGMANGDPMSTVLNIPVLSTTKASGATLRKAMLDGDVMVHFGRARDIDREGALDSSVLFHEWGHYLHHRLAYCGNSQQCSAMSEGWGDFQALFTSARDGDNLDGTYAMGIYASAQFPDPAYFGIRRQPYSIDFHKNALTFHHISEGVDLPKRQVRNGSGGDNSEVHNAGEIWATMMWEAYVGLQKSGQARTPALTFDQVRRRMANYVVRGLQMTPQNATYLEARDAIIAAAHAADPEDEKAIADAFSRRGAGTCADGPPRSSITLEGVVEGFTVQPRLVVGDVTLTELPGSCTDGDGVLDAGEHAKVTITLSNGALQPLSGAKLNLSAGNKEVSFVGPASFDVPDLASFESTMVETEIAVDQAMADAGVLTLFIDPSPDAACAGVKREFHWKINYDIAKASSTTDSVEAVDTAWMPGSPNNDGDVFWTRVAADETSHVWRGTDYGDISDTWLESPDLTVSTTDFFLMRFEHRFSFDARDVTGTKTYFDGGVIEISEDGGMTWRDFSEAYVTPGYNNTIAAGSGNPLAKHLAFVDKSFDYPKTQRLTMNFLDHFAGKTVRVRFRIVTDNAYGATGWEIDNVSFQGITNTPFDGIVYDAGKCGTGPRGPMAMPMGGCGIARSATPGAALLGLALCALALRVARRRRSS